MKMKRMKRTLGPTTGTAWGPATGICLVSSVSAWWLGLNDMVFASFCQSEYCHTSQCWAAKGPRGGQRSRKAQVFRPSSGSTSGVTAVTTSGMRQGTRLGGHRLAKAEQCSLCLVQLQCAGMFSGGRAGHPPPQAG